MIPQVEVGEAENPGLFKEQCTAAVNPHSGLKLKIL
jgi:hypothetical protein